MPARSTPRYLLLIWTTVLLAPLAWGASLVAMFWMTHPVCQGLTRASIVEIGVACIIIAAVSGLVARGTLRRLDSSTHGDFDAFLLRMAMWSSAIFALVIALSVVPTALLTPCPV
jgi:hypothetical protein